MFRHLLESIELLKISDFSDFCDVLSLYIEYNKDEGLKKYLLEMKKMNLLNKKDKLYKIVKLKNPSDYNPNSKELTSTSTTQLSGYMLDEMKDTVNQYVKDGDFYLVEIGDAIGLDVNLLYRKFFKGKQKELTKDEVIGNQPIGLLYDTFKEKYKQNEFIVLGKHTVKSIKEI